MGKKRERIAELEEQVSVLLAKCHALSTHNRYLETEIQKVKHDHRHYVEQYNVQQEIQQAGVWR